MASDIIIAFRPVEIKNLVKSHFNVAMINDSKWFISFSLIRTTMSHGILMLSDFLEPATELSVGTTTSEDILLWSDFLFQGLLVEEDGSDVHEPINVHCSIDPDMFHRESSFRRPLYSERPALELPLVQDDMPVSYTMPEVERIRETMGTIPATGLEDLRAKYNADKYPLGPRRDKRSGSHSAGSPFKVLPTVEVDLHIHELVDTTTGLDNTAMIELQLDTVRRTMRAHQRRKGQRIVFIHGKGDGVLRAAVRKLLSKEFRSCQVEDADFRRYGFGATLVIVR